MERIGELEARVRYMRAWIRSNSAADSAGWEPQQVIETFLLMPPCPVDYGDWLDGMRAALGWEIVDDAAASNDAFLSSVTSLPFVTVAKAG